MQIRKRDQLEVAWDVFETVCYTNTSEQRSKPLADIPLNPGWLMGILISWFIKIAIELGSIIPFIQQIARVLVTAQVIVSILYHQHHIFIYTGFWFPSYTHSIPPVIVFIYICCQQKTTKIHRKSLREPYTSPQRVVKQARSMRP